MSVLVALAFAAVSATIINVPDDYETIQEGIIFSSNGDTVLVQPDTYHENISFNGHNIVLGSLFLTTGDTSFISTTIIDGNSSGPVVLFNSYEDSSTAILGFTIQNGYAEQGGGVHCYSSSPTIDNNSIRENIASIEGGGIFCQDSNPVIINNFIFANHTFPQYSAGGGIYCSNSDAIICLNIISQNSSSHLGGGIYYQGGNPRITNNIIRENSANSSGGGVFCSGSSSSITNNVIYSNLTDWIGGGITCNYCNPHISNNIVTQNLAYEAGGIYCWESSPIITNTIFWADSALENANEISFNEGSLPNLSYCDIQGGWEGEGNIDTDPKFRDPDNGDFHLMATYCGDPYDSPCIDAGHPDSLDAFLNCQWGLGSERADMGAYGGSAEPQTEIKEREYTIPNQSVLMQNYPNPFNASTTIRYTLIEPSHITIGIYDILGRKVTTLINKQQSVGNHQVIWNAEDAVSVMYFYNINAGSYTETRKMLFIK